MQGLLQTYTQYFNREYKRVGHLFQGRYKAIVCDRDVYLQELVHYIHLNPVRADMVSHPDEYPWSSHQGYIGKKIMNFLDADLILGQFSGHRGEARTRYLRFILDGIREGHNEKYYQVLDQRFLGDKGFIKEVIEQAQKINATSKLKPRQKSLNAILDSVVRRKGLAEEIILSQSKIQAVVKARRLFILLAIKKYGYKVSEGC